MATIEKRAYDLHKKVEQRLCSLFESGSTSIFKIHANVVDLIQEQDRIARQEERERCINTIRDQMNKLLYPIEDIDLICDHVRKAIEEGGNYGNM